jgi:hypothetical protein
LSQILRCILHVAAEGSGIPIFLKQAKVDESQDPARGENWRKEQKILLSKARIFTSLDEVPFCWWVLFSKRKKWGLAEGGDTETFCQGYNRSLP